MWCKSHNMQGDGVSREEGKGRALGAWATAPGRSTVLSEILAASPEPPPWQPLPAPASPAFKPGFASRARPPACPGPALAPTHTDPPSLPLTCTRHRLAAPFSCLECAPLLTSLSCLRVASCRADFSLILSPLEIQAIVTALRETTEVCVGPMDGWGPWRGPWRGLGGWLLQEAVVKGSLTAWSLLHLWVTADISLVTWGSRKG